MGGFTISDLLIVVATFLGPIVAVGITRWGDDRRVRRERQSRVFETLMLTRRSAMSREHVGALNQIEIEFAGDREIMAAYRKYLDTFSDIVPSDPDQFEGFQRRRTRLFAELVQLIGQRLRFHVDKMDLIEGGYAPRGWQADEELMRDNARKLNSLLRGQAPLWVVNVPPPSGGLSSPFPPPPQPQPFPPVQQGQVRPNGPFPPAPES